MYKAPLFIALINMLGVLSMRRQITARKGGGIMNIKKYAFWSLLFFLSTIYGMEPLPKSPKKDQQFLKNENPENRIGKKAKKIDIHIKMPSKPLSNSVGPQESVLAGSTRTSQGKEKKNSKRC